MNETEQEIYEYADNPYGIPVIHFPSDSGDSTIFVTPGHIPPNKRALATLNWIFRTYRILIFSERDLQSFSEWGFASYEADGNSYNITIIHGGAAEGLPVTFMEV